MLNKVQLLILILFQVCVTSAQIPARYAHNEIFNMADGLEHSVISDMRTDQNDLLWISVRGKLQLFDGDQFVDMSHLIHSANSSGEFGFENGKDILFLKTNILYTFSPQQYTSAEAPHFVFPMYSKKGAHPKIIYEDGEFVYIYHPNDSLYQIDKLSLTATKKYFLPHQPHSNYRWSSIYISPEPVSTIHYMDTNYLYCSFELITGKTTIHSDRGNVFRGAIASGDTMLILQTNTLDLYVKGQKQSVKLPEEGLTFNGQHFLLVGRDSVYVSLRNAIYIFNLRTMQWESRLERTGGVSIFDLRVRSVVEDKSGHLYFSTFNSGFVKMYLADEGFQYLGIQGSKNYFIKCIRVSEKNNLVLAGTLKDGLIVFDTNGVLKHHIFLYPNGDTIQLVSAILKITDTRYILITDRILELIFQDEGYSLIAYENQQKNRFTYYDIPIEDTLHHRFFIFNHREIIEIKPDDQPQVQINKIYKSGSSTSATLSGDHYIHSVLDELIFYNQALHPRPIKFNVPSFGYTRCLVPYTKDQFLLATDLGIFILDTLHREKPQTPLYDHLVYAILPGSKDKEFWFSTDYGLYRLNEDLSYKRFAIESGLQENEFNTNSCYKSESGKLYFGGINGITAFYPEQITNEEDTPLPYISAFSINGKVKERYITPGKDHSFNLKYNENVIQLRLLGKGRRSPRSYNFQYMVKGVHSEWINLGRNMDIQLQLAPGRYTLYFHIADSFAPQAETIHAIQLYIQPPIYKRWWFITILSLIPLYLLYYFMNLRRKRLALKLAYMQELERKIQEDRMRISRDLHDNIGAQMATVKRGINFLIDHGDRLTSDQTRNKMQDLETISTQINQELRDTIWAVQNEQIDVAGFITRLKNYVFKLVGPESTNRIIYEEHGDMHLILGPFIALNLHRICQEAFNNILKHADATEISIIFECKDDSLKISIADNGKGFDPELISEGYGLSNIRKRGEQIGAEVFFNRLKDYSSSLEITLSTLMSTVDNKRKDGTD